MLSNQSPTPGCSMIFLSCRIDLGYQTQSNQVSQKTEKKDSHNLLPIGQEHKVIRVAGMNSKNFSNIFNQTNSQGQNLADVHSIFSSSRLDKNSVRISDLQMKRKSLKHSNSNQSIKDQQVRTQRKSNNINSNTFMQKINFVNKKNSLELHQVDKNIVQNKKIEFSDNVHHSKTIKNRRICTEEYDQPIKKKLKINSKKNHYFEQSQGSFCDYDINGIKNILEPNFQRIHPNGSVVSSRAKISVDLMLKPTHNEYAFNFQMYGNDKIPSNQRPILSRQKQNIPYHSQIPTGIKICSNRKVQKVQTLANLDTCKVVLSNGGDKTSQNHISVVGSIEQTNMSQNNIYGNNLANCIKYMTTKNLPLDQNVWTSWHKSINQ